MIIRLECECRIAIFQSTFEKKFGFFPITTTSVNRTNNPPLGDPKYIREQFSSEIDLIVDAGVIKNRKASTIYKLIDSKFTVIRSG
ncbi:MAG: hypothetical protein Ct9H90mP7_2700 [Candidatus Neomarinimicrobiota bacterium]|nr:MAG: hypothetical protein Ct9H90mP7_2700 [Candidatus Neomarinimicrobiota bacterium]